MSSFLPLRVLFAFALLSCGVATAALAVNGAPTVDAELVPSTVDIAGAALPAHGLASLATQVETDGRGIRLTHSFQTARERSRTQHARTQTNLANSRGTAFSDVGARLLRGGIDSSTLGTPPPQS